MRIMKFSKQNVLFKLLYGELLDQANKSAEQLVAYSLRSLLLLKR